MVFVLAVLFIVCMLLWGVLLFGGEGPYTKHRDLLAFLCVLWLGLLVLLAGFGVVTWRSLP